MHFKKEILIPEVFNNTLHLRIRKKYPRINEKNPKIKYAGIKLDIAPFNCSMSIWEDIYAMQAIEIIKPNRFCFQFFMQS